MVDNPTKIYNDYVRANLPNSMSYDTGTDRYDINSHSFFKFKNSNWYFNYISKYGYSALTAYAVNGLEPALVFDFKNDYFRKSATDSTFGASITHAATTNATMVDADGLLKWRPHNVAKYSEDFTNAAWLIDAAGITKTATEITETATTAPHYTRQSMTVVGGRYTATVDLKPNGRQWAWLYADTLGSASAYFDLTNGVVGSTVGTGVTSSIIDLEDGYFRCTMSKTAALSANFGFGLSTADGTTSYLGDVTKSLFARKVHVYRSDLGGMVNNPDTSNSYVPTTTTRVYAPRRGHHVYNGSAWVNEGILHESEARTNLLTYSNDLSNGAWSNTNSSNTANAGVSPDGTSNATKVVPTTNAGIHYTYRALSLTSADYSFSVYVASSGYGFATICAGSISFSDYYAVVIDLSDGTQTALYSAGLQPKTVTVEPVGSYYRVTISGNRELYYVVGASDTGTYTPSDYGFKSFSGDGTSGILVYGAQLEAGSTASSYIPTNAGATVTRAAETLTVPAANLPWPTPVETTGTELVTNGTFATDTDWTLDAASSITGGELVSTKTNAGVIASQSVSFVAGKVYLVTFDFTNPNNRILVPRFSGGTTASSPATTGSAGSYSNYITANAGNNTFQWNSAGTGFQGTIDNISVKEVNPLSVSIQMDGKMTYADTGIAAEVGFTNWFVSGTDNLSSRLDTAGAETGRAYFKQEYAGANYIVEGPADTYSPSVNVPFNIASRHGSTFINGAVGGTALTANTTPTTLPDLSATDLFLGNIFMGTIGQFRMWSDDITDAGITEAST